MYFESRHTDVDDIARQLAASAYMQTEVVQLSAGLLRFATRGIELDGLTLLYCELDARSRWRDAYDDDHVRFGIPLHCEKTSLCNGSELHKGSAYLSVGEHELELVSNGPSSGLEIIVDVKLAETLGLQYQSGLKPNLDPAALENLLRTCTGALSSARVPPAADARKALSRDRILDDLSRVLRSWTKPVQDGKQSPLTAKRAALLVKQAEAFFELGTEDQSLLVEDLCDAIGVSRSTLFRAFQSYLGIGPRRFLELKRLYQLRRRLKLAHKSETTVTCEAVKLGFTELGRLSALYHSHFRELPSATLRRQDHI